MSLFCLCVFITFGEINFNVAGVTSILPPELTTVNPCYTAINLISAAP
jgi:pyruvoyl-dependent arginine decarboxylase (PvlArgDC)